MGFSGHKASLINSTPHDHSGAFFHISAWIIKSSFAAFTQLKELLYVLIRKHTLSKGVNESIIQLNQAFAWKLDLSEILTIQAMLGRPAKAKPLYLVLSCFHYEGFPILTMLFQLPHSFHLSGNLCRQGAGIEGFVFWFQTHSFHIIKLVSIPQSGWDQMLILFEEFNKPVHSVGSCWDGDHSWICDIALQIAPSTRDSVGSQKQHKAFLTYILKETWR